jgi:hypothetical protein
MPKMVEDVLLGWEKMEGKTAVHKQINAVLTAIHIGRNSMPADECEDEAGVLLGLQGIVEAGEWDLRVLWFLKERFATCRKEEGGVKTLLPDREPACEVSAKIIGYLIEHYGPVPEHTLVDLVEGAMRRIGRVVRQRS